MSLNDKYVSEPALGSVPNSDLKDEEGRNGSIVLQPPQGQPPKAPKVGIHPISIDDLPKEGTIIPKGNENKTEYQTLDVEDPPLADVASMQSKQQTKIFHEKKGLMSEPKMAKNARNY